MPLLLASATLAALLSQNPTNPPNPTNLTNLTNLTNPPNPFLHLLTNLGEDLKNLGSTDTLWIGGVGAAATLFAKNNDDERMHKWVIKQPNREPSLSSAGNVIGDGFVQGGAAVGVWLAGRATDNVKVENVGADLIRAQLLNGVLTQGIKIGAHRTRPDGGSRSFPSGHTSASFATAAVIERHYGVAASTPFYALGGFIGWSRIRTNHHWLSDVVAGAALGMISGRAATRHQLKNWTVTPVKTQGGAALYVVRTSVK